MSDRVDALDLVIGRWGHQAGSGAAPRATQPAWN
jgi:hypothetical protein